MGAGRLNAVRGTAALGDAGRVCRKRPGQPASAGPGRELARRCFAMLRIDLEGRYGNKSVSPIGQDGRGGLESFEAA